MTKTMKRALPGLPLVFTLVLGACALGNFHEEVGQPVQIGADAQGNQIYEKCLVSGHGKTTGPQIVNQRCYHVYADGRLVKNEPVSDNSAATPAMADGIASNALPAAIIAGGMVGAGAVLRPAKIGGTNNCGVGAGVGGGNVNC